MLNNTSLQKVDVLLTLKRTCNVLIHIFKMKHFLTMLVSHEVVENWILFKMRGGGKIYDKVWRSYAQSKFSWLFFGKPKFGKFDFWSNLEFSWWIMINPWSNDECYLKILMLTKNYKVWLYVDHSWLFVQYNWFSTIWAIVWGNLTCKAWNLTWRIFKAYEEAWWPLEMLETHLDLRIAKP